MKACHRGAHYNRLTKLFYLASKTQETLSNTAYDIVKKLLISKPKIQTIFLHIHAINLNMQMKILKDLLCKLGGNLLVKLFLHSCEIDLFHFLKVPPTQVF